MGRHLGIGAVDRRLVEASFGDARAQIVGHHHRRNPTHEREAARVHLVDLPGEDAIRDLDTPEDWQAWYSQAAPQDPGAA